MIAEKGASPSLPALQAMADAIMPAGMVAVCRDPAGDVGTLFAEEKPAVERAVARRQAEFAAGRSAARDALQQLGLAPMAIPAGADRAPVWPADVTGSISHSRTAVIVVVDRLDRTGRYIGVDVEEATELEEELWASICRPAELAWLSARPDAALWAKIVFSIKEAVYKAQYPLTGRMLDFQEVELTALDPEGRFTAHVLIGESKTVTGRFRASDHFILALAQAWGPAEKS